MTDTTTPGAPDTDLATELPIRRPSTNQYLAGNYAPVESEVTAHDLPVVGQRPIAADHLEVGQLAAVNALRAEHVFVTFTQHLNSDRVSIGC